MAASQESAVELQQLITELLARFGVAGTVTVNDGRATLFGSGPTVEVDVETMLADWQALGDDPRRKRALDVARRLAGERRRSGSPTDAPRGSGMSAWVAVAMVGIVTTALAAGAWFWRSRSPGDAAAKARRETARVDYDAYERDRQERAERVCNATRSRIVRGAPIGPSDVEGWVVELSLLSDKDSPDPASDPTVATFVSAGVGGRGRIVWPQAGAIANLEGPDTEAVVSKADLPPGAPEFKGLRVVLTGRYVGAYFDEEARVTLVRMALALSEALHAQYAALYARCAAGRAHHLGSLFRGPTPGGAVTSLLYFMGAFGDVPDVRRSELSPTGEGEDPAFAFRNIARATAPLKKNRVMAMVGAEGGMISGLDDQPSTVSFPPRDPNRASRASHSIARDLGIGEGR